MPRKTSLKRRRSESRSVKADNVNNNKNDNNNNDNIKKKNGIGKENKVNNTNNNNNNSNNNNNTKTINNRKKSSKKKKKSSMKKDPKDVEKKKEEEEKKKQKEVIYNTTVDDYSFDKAIPNGCKMLAKHYDDLWHWINVLESKRVDDPNLPSFAVEAVKEVPKDAAPHDYVYYCHYREFNRRMDRWMGRHLMIFEEEVNDKNTIKQLDGNENVDDHHGDFDDHALHAHEEATKVKNVDSIVFGRYEMETWYFSPFPLYYSKYSTLYFCEYCLAYFGHHAELCRHASRCTLRHPPGNEIYRSKEQNIDVSVWELDGKKTQVWCQNLCYIAKLFLDHKTLQYDTEPFLFYVLTEEDEHGHHIVGYFSKEKQSEDGYNVACILTLPCHQRKGYGRFLISLSYELSKIERKQGSPEKPLSDLGAVSYKSYWSRTLVRKLLEFGAETLSIRDLARMTSIKVDDIVNTLKEIGVLIYNGEYFFVLTDDICIKYLKPKRAIDPNSVYVQECDPKKLHWTPYIVPSKRQRGHTFN